MFFHRTIDVVFYFSYKTQYTTRYCIWTHSTFLVMNILFNLGSFLDDQRLISLYCIFSWSTVIQWSCLIKIFWVFDGETCKAFV